MSTFLAKLINSADKWAQSHKRIVRDQAILWFDENGAFLDWWSTKGAYKIKKGDNVICPKGEKCQNTYWLCGECVQDHWIGNFMYAYLGKLLNVPDWTMNFAGFVLQGGLEPPWDTAGYKIARNVYKRKSRDSICNLIKQDKQLWDKANNTSAKSRFEPHAKNYQDCIECDDPLPKDVENTLPGGHLGPTWPALPKSYWDD